MKTKLYLLLILLISFKLLSYDLFPSTWLNSADSYEIFRNDTLHGVPNALIPSSLPLTLSYWKFDDCTNFIDESGLVDDIPDLIPMPNSSNVSECIVRYNKIYEVVLGVPEERRNWYGICRATGSTIDIILNSNAQREWGSSMTGSGFDQKVDINTTLRHEYGHALGLDHSGYVDALMYDYEGDPYFTNRIINYTNDEINGLREIYEKPKVRVISPHTFRNDTVIIFKSPDTVDIEFEVRTPSMLEYNSVTPPDLTPVGFFTDTTGVYYYNYDAAFNSLGNDIYRFKTNIDSFITENGTDLQKLRTYVKRDSFPTYGDYRLYNSPDSSLVFEIKAQPKIIEPLIEDNHLIPPLDGKGVITDTIKVVVAIPEI